MSTITLPVLTDIEECAKSICNPCRDGVQLSAPRDPEKPWIHVWPNDEWEVCAANDIRTWNSN